MPQIVLQVKGMEGIVTASFTTALNNVVAYLPQLFGGLLVLMLGWFASRLLGKMTERALDAARFKMFADTFGVTDFLDRAGFTRSASNLMGDTVKWLLRVVVVQTVASILLLPQIVAVLGSFIAFLPRLIVATAIFLGGAMASKIAARATRATFSELGAGNPVMFSKLAEYAVLGVVGSAALSHLGIGAVIVNALFIAVVSSVALAVGIAFGLGAKDSAAEITQNWLESTRGMSKSTSEMMAKKKVASLKILD